MSDQGNDDIKQLYGHLGLDPRSYREIRDDKAEKPEAGKSGDWSLLRAVRSRLDQGAPPPQAPPAASPTPPSADARPDSAQQASYVPQEPPAARVEPTLAPPTPVPGRESLAASLLASLKAYEVDRSAQRAASPAAAAPEPMGAGHTRSEAPPAQAAAEPGASRPPAASAEDGRSIEVSLRSAIWPSVPPNSPTQPAMPEPEPPTAESVPPTAPDPEPQFSPTSAQPRASSLMRGVSDGLVSTFRRLEAPRPLTNPDLAKLRLNYGARSEAHGVSQPRDANLREVFARLKRVGDDH